MKDVVQIAKVAKIWDGTAWVDLATSVPDLSNYQLKSEGGLTFVKKQTIGTAVSSVTVTDAFSATYDNYKIVISGGASSNLTDIYLQLGASADEYYAVYSYGSYNTSTASFILNDNDAAQWTRAIYGHQSNGIVGDLDLLQPNQAKYTMIFASAVHASGAGGFNGVHKVATSYTDFKITAGSGTLTGGTIYVYGYNKG